MVYNQNQNQNPYGGSQYGGGNFGGNYGGIKIHTEDLNMEEILEEINSNKWEDTMII